MFPTWTSNSGGDTEPPKDEDGVEILAPPVGYRPHLQETEDGKVVINLGLIDDDDHVEGEVKSESSSGEEYDSSDEESRSSEEVDDKDIEEHANTRKLDPPTDNDRPPEDEEPQALIAELIDTHRTTLHERENEIKTLRSNMDRMKKMFKCFSFIMVSLFLLTGGLSLFYFLSQDKESIVSECLVEGSSLLGDGICHDFEPHNTGECGYDGGDCISKIPTVSKDEQ